jgi:hypothetical protein
MINRSTHREGIVLVKTGQTEVDIDELARVADADTDTYAFSTAASPECVSSIRSTSRRS